MCAHVLHTRVHTHIYIYGNAKLHTNAAGTGDKTLFCFNVIDGERGYFTELYSLSCVNTFESFSTAGGFAPKSG